MVSHENGDVQHHIQELTDAVSQLVIVDVHPAIVSGPSSNPDLQLMGIPQELREQIFSYSLIKYECIYVMFTRLKKTDPRHNRGYGFPMKGFRSGLAVGKGVTNLLLCCKRIYNESHQILYGRNRFVTYNFRGLSASFVGHPKYGIGIINAKLIKKLTMGVPEDVKFGGEAQIIRFASKVCYILSGLRELLLTTKFIAYPLEEPGPRGWPGQYTGMVYAAAAITEKHPVLKKAIWQASSGLYELYDIHSDWCQFNIVLEPVDVTQQIKTFTNGNMRGVLVEKRDIILDSLKIRASMMKQSVVDLASGMNNDFALPDDAISSEPVVNKVMKVAVKTETPKARADAIRKLKSWR